MKHILDKYNTQMDNINMLFDACCDTSNLPEDATLEDKTACERQFSGLESELQYAIRKMRLFIKRYGNSQDILDLFEEKVKQIANRGINVEDTLFVKEVTPDFEWMD